MLLLATSPDRAGTLSRMERALRIQRQRPCTPGPGIRLTSQQVKGAKKSQNQAGPGVVAAFFCCNKGKEMELIPKWRKGT